MHDVIDYAQFRAIARRVTLARVVTQTQKNIPGEIYGNFFSEYVSR